MNVKKVYIGFDERERDAYDVAKFSLERRSSIPLAIEPLILSRLTDAGLIDRLQDRRGQVYDLRSSAPCSTDFAVSRFLVPMLAQTGPTLFMDCDMLFQADVKELFDLFDPRYAVQVVKHKHEDGAKIKMDGCTQQYYARKNWSSVVLWNTDHPANARLTVTDVNRRPGRDLHAFYWLHDSEIGELPPEWNWLVGVQSEPEQPKLVHYTMGTPNMAYAANTFADQWFREFALLELHRSRT